MSAADDTRRRSATQPGAAPTFSLERFGWGAPDRLELAGVFSGIADVAFGDPVLAVHGPDGTHRLPAIEGAEGEPPTDGERWTAAFAWQEAPVAFHRARLELGASVAVELPAPGDGVSTGPLPVEPAPADRRTIPDIEGTADRLRREAQLLDEALAAAAEARTQADLEAQEELGSLRRQIAALEPQQAELESVRDELESVRDELEAVRSELAATRSALVDARTGAKDLLDRIARLADPPAGGR